MSRRLAACSPGSTMRQLAHTPGPGGRIGTPVATPLVAHRARAGRRSRRRRPSRPSGREVVRRAASRSARSASSRRTPRCRRSGSAAAPRRAVCRRFAPSAPRRRRRPRRPDRPRCDRVEDSPHGNGAERDHRPRRRAGARRHDRPAAPPQRRRLGRRAGLRDAFEQFDASTRPSASPCSPGSGGYFCAGADLKALSEGDRRPVGDDRARADGADRGCACRSR